MATINEMNVETINSSNIWDNRWSKIESKINITNLETKITNIETTFNTKINDIKNDYKIKIKKVKKESILWAIFFAIITWLLTNFLYDLIK